MGIQTFDEQVAARISRRQDNQKLADNLRFLREQTGVHVHADLIVGLPGEDLATFAAGFDRLVALGPQEIQVGILKRLRGTPIVRHDLEWCMVYSRQAPYEVLQTSTMDFATIQELRRFSRFWDLIANSGNFLQTTPLIWRDEPSQFQTFLSLSEWLFSRIGRQHGIALNRLTELVFEYLTKPRGLDQSLVAQTLSSDYLRAGRFDMPEFLRPYLPDDQPRRRGAQTSRSLPRRQARHIQ